MGIPHLLRHLAPYAETIVLGCKAKSCEEHPTAEKIVIDGPSLAYYIYYRILAHRPADLCPVDAIPSYDELGKAVLTFLEELQCCGAIMYAFHWILLSGFSHLINYDIASISTLMVVFQLARLRFAKHDSRLV